jgi:FSR family fosmidomycin resistance protein-like MFS transporter
VAIRSDIRVMTIIGAAHFASHFFHLVLPPLFPMMREALGASYTQLGGLVSVFFAVSATAQTPAGFLVDRVGPQIVLPCGLAVLAGATALAGLVPSYAALLACAALAGLGNSVFHPADFTAMNGRVSPPWIGRAYSIHTIAGMLGWAAPPVTLLALAQHFGWRAALVQCGLAGLLLAACIAAGRGTITVAGRSRARGGGADWRPLLAPAIVSCLVYFILLSIAQGSLQNFLPTLLPMVQEVPFAMAAGATTLLLVGSAFGALVGGYLADTVRNHSGIVAGGLTGCAALSALLGLVSMPTVALVLTSVCVGFLFGLTIPSRDMLVRSATPSGATGAVFGFVYSGGDLGVMIAPLAIGAFLDWGAPRGAFIFIAATLAMTIASALFVGRTPRAMQAAGGR